MNSELESTKRRAYRAAEHAVLPDYMKERMQDLRYWETKREFWQQKVDEATAADQPPVWTGTAHRKLTEVSEILSVVRRDIIQMRQRLM